MPRWLAEYIGAPSEIGWIGIAGVVVADLVLVATAAVIVRTVLGG